MVVFQKTGRLFYNGGVQMETMPSETAFRRHRFLYRSGKIRMRCAGLSALLTILPSETIFSGLKFDAKPVSDGMDVVESCRLCVKPPRSAYFAISLFQELKNVY